MCDQMSDVLHLRPTDTAISLYGVLAKYPRLYVRIGVFNEALYWVLREPGLVSLDIAYFQSPTEATQKRLIMMGKYCKASLMRVSTPPQKHQLYYLMCGMQNLRSVHFSNPDSYSYLNVPVGITNLRIDNVYGVLDLPYEYHGVEHIDICFGSTQCDEETMQYGVKFKRYALRSLKSLYIRWPRRENYCQIDTVKCMQDLLYWRHVKITIECPMSEPHPMDNRVLTPSISVPLARRSSFHVKDTCDSFFDHSFRFEGPGRFAPFMPGCACMNNNLQNMYMQLPDSSPCSSSLYSSSSSSLCAEQDKHSINDTDY